MHVPSEQKSDDLKGSLYEELEQVLIIFLSAKVRRENIFKQTTGNESLHQEIVMIMVSE